MEEFQKLYRDNYKRVYYYLINLCRSHSLAEDLTQETFYNALLHIYNKKNMRICSNWFLKIAHNAFIDYIRKNKTDIDSLDSYEKFLPAAKINATHKLDFINLFGRLPTRYRALILLKDHYGFSNNEIAEITGCSETVIRVTLHRARNKLKEVYLEYERTETD